MKTFQFPEKFLWGAATAGHQVEGNNTNSESWVLEHLPGTIYAEPSGIACDHYSRYAEDIKLLADLGFNSYRFSIEWARIEPTQGEFSRDALDHYRNVLETCREHGLAPVITLHHFISPAWLMKEGGWVSPSTPALYANYAAKVMGHLGDLAEAVVTFNEPNIARVLKYLLPFSVTESEFWKTAADAFGVSPERLGLFQFVADERLWDVVHHAHRLAFNQIKNAYPDLPTGLSLALHDYQIVDGGEEMAKHIRQNLADDFLQRLGDDDFVGVQTYSRMRIGPEGILEPDPLAEVTQTHEEFYPEAIGPAATYASKTAGIPALITENGVSCIDDSRRVEYYRRAITSVASAMHQGTDIRGYFAWTAMDNFEWVSGFEPKFGIIAVDRNTLARSVKPSARMLGKVAKDNRIILE